MGSISRRQFIKIGAASASSAALASGLVTEWWGVDRSQLQDPSTDGDKVYFIRMESTSANSRR